MNWLAEACVTIGSINPGARRFPGSETASWIFKSKDSNAGHDWRHRDLLSAGASLRRLSEFCSQASFAALKARRLWCMRPSGPPVPLHDVLVCLP